MSVTPIKITEFMNFGRNQLQVKVWFQNRRTKFRKVMGEMMRDANARQQSYENLMH